MMDKYVVAYVNFFDNKLELHEVFAINETQAALAVLCGDKGWAFNSIDSLEDIKAEAFNGDTLVEVLKI